MFYQRVPFGTFVHQPLPTHEPLTGIALIIIDPTPLRADGGGEGPRMEIITRPGTGRWRRSVDLDFSDESLDATTPGERTKPARQTRNLDVDLRGPVVLGPPGARRRASTNTRQRAANSLRAITPAGNVFDGRRPAGARARAGSRCRHRRWPMFGRPSPI